MATGCWYKEHLFHRFPLDSVTSSQIYGYDNQPTNPMQIKPFETQKNKINWTEHNTMKCVMNGWLDGWPFKSISRDFCFP